DEFWMSPQRERGRTHQVVSFPPAGFPPGRAEIFPEQESSMPPTAAPPASEVERRKKVRIRIRRDLAIAPQKYEGRTYYVVKDPVSLRYFRFKEQEHFLIRLMDGTHTLDDAQKAYEKRFRPERLTLEDLESFAQQLLNAGLAQNESP